MSDKLLHERLREHAAKDIIGDFACGNTKIVSLRADEALALADEIERQYVPVPRFPDGEPVREGSETRYGTVSYIDVEVSDTCWGNWIMHTDDDNCVEGTLSQRVERPAPKSLDADGVETKAGDTVWLHDKVDGGPVREPMKVTEVLCDGTLVFEGGGAMPARLVTHREPDSLEKLRASIKAVSTVACGASKGEVKEWADRLTALMERGA